MGHLRHGVSECLPLQVDLKSDKNVHSVNNGGKKPGRRAKGEGRQRNRGANREQGSRGAKQGGREARGARRGAKQGGV